MPVRINANIKGATVNELVARRKVLLESYSNFQKIQNIFRSFTTKEKCKS